MKFTLATLSLFASTAQAWDVDYEGFIHMKNTDGTVQFTTTDAIKNADGKMPVSLSKDWCFLESKCETFYSSSGESETYFFSNFVSSDWDVFMSYTNTAVTGDPLCTIDAAVGPGSVDTKWLKCDYYATFFESNLIAEFDLPPDIIASTCVSNPACVGE